MCTADGESAGPGAEPLIADLGFARLDLERAVRTGVPEVVLAEGKRDEQVLVAMETLRARHGLAFATRVRPELAAVLAARWPDVRLNPDGRTAMLGRPPDPVGEVLVITAGTADLPVAEEVVETLRFCGSGVARLTDVGVSGLHRLLAQLPVLSRARVILVVAGMDGALPAVVTGLTCRPVIGVPTPTGYGVAASGRAALNTMLASCAAGLAVVNIGNGFGAAVLADRINRRLGG